MDAASTEAWARDPEVLEQVFHAAASKGDAEGVDAALRLMAVCDPHRAGRLFDSLKATLAIEVRDDADGTDSLIERATVLLDREDVDLRGEEWCVERETPYALILRQWREHDHDEPTGPKVRVTFTVHVEEL